MPDIPGISELEKKKRELQASLNEYERGKQLSREIVELSNKKVSAEKEIADNLNYGRKIGAVDRLGRALTAFSTTNSTYVASKAAVSGKHGGLDIAAIQARQYSEDVVSNLRSVITGTDYRRRIQKEGTDLLTDFLGQKKGTNTTLKGIAYDTLLGDPSSVVTRGASMGLKAFNTTFQATSKFSSIASRIPAIKKGMETVGRSFDIFYDLDRSGIRPEKIEEFKDAFRAMAATGNDFWLRQLEKQMPMQPGSATNAVWQRMTNLGYGQGPGKLSGYTFPKEQAKILQEAFGPQEQYTGISKAIDWTNSKFKSVLAYNPKWQTRNVIDAMIKNQAEGVTVGDYARGIFARLKGGVDTQMGLMDRNSKGLGYVDWKDIEEAGLTGSTGPMDTASKSVIGKITNFFETTFARVPLAMKKMRTGEVKSVAAAGKAVEDVHYNYTRAYLTGFEKRVNDLFLPYYKYEKGQMKYWPDALVRKQRTFGGLYHAQDNTLDPTYRDNPQMKPPWMDFMMSGTMGNYGSSMEDFAKTITLATSTLNKISVLPRTAVEGATDYSFANGQSISGNKYAGRYAHAGPILKDIVGYNPVTNETENTKMRWLLEATLGPLLQPYLQARDPQQNWKSVAFSARDYKFTPDQLQYMNSLKASADPGTGGMIGNIISTVLSKLNISVGRNMSTAGTPSPQNPVPVTVVPGINTREGLAAKTRSHDDQAWNQYAVGRFGAGVDTKFAKENAPYIYGKDPESRRVAEKRNETVVLDLLGTSMAKMAETSAKAYNLAFNTQLESEIKKLELANATPEELARHRNQRLTEASLTAPRGPGEYFPGLDVGNLGLKVTGKTEWGQVFNRFKTEAIEFASKTATMYSKLADKDFIADIQRRAYYETEAVDTAVAGSSGNMGPLAGRRKQAISVIAQRDMQLAMEKTESAFLKFMDNFVSGMEDSVEKLDLLEKQDLAKYDKDKEARMVRENMSEEMFQIARMGITKKYDDLRAKQQAKDAKQMADVLVATGKDEVNTIASALKAIYDRGGLSITDYFSRLTQDQLKLARDAGTATVTEFISGLKMTKMSDVGIVAENPAAIEAKKKLEELTGKINEKGTKEEQISALSALQDYMLKIYEAGEADLSISGEALKRMGELLKNLGVNIDGLVKQADDDRQKLADAIRTMQRANNEIYMDVWKNQTPKSIGDWWGQANADKSGELINAPDVRQKPAGYSPMTAEWNEKIRLQKVSSATSLSKALEMPGGGFEGFKRFDEVGEDPNVFLERLRLRIEEEQALVLDGETEKNDKLRQLKETFAAESAKIDETTISREKAIANAKVEIGLQMANQMMAVATMLYEASGKQSKEAFYVMKSIAIAECIVRGISATMAAFEQGSEINIYLGYAQAAAAAAFAGTQLGLLIDSTVQGPEGKAEGGSIEGGSGTKDDVPIMAMGGEYMMRQAAVNKYGKGFMESVNSCMFDPGNSTFAMPDIPTSSRGVFADGGPVANMNVEKSDQRDTSNLQIVNIIDPALVDKYMSTPSGQRTILNVMAANKYEINKIMQS